MGAQHSQISDGGSQPSKGEDERMFFDDRLGILPNDEIKLRGGSKLESMRSPFASGQSQYGLIMQQEKWRMHLFANLNDDYLVGSILTSNAAEEDVLTSNISCKAMDAEQIETVQRDMRNFDDSIASGINIHVDEAVDVSEKSLKLSSTSLSPCFQAYQRRLALLAGMRDIVSAEHEKAVDQYKPRVYSKRTQKFNSGEFPELALMQSLKDTGVHYLQMYAASQRLLSLTSADNDNPVQDEYVKILATMEEPIKLLCNEVCCANSLELFPAWAPAPEPPQLTIKMNNATAHASSGSAILAIDDNSNTCWSTSNLRSSWSVKFVDQALLSAVQISWVPNGTLSGGGGGPKR